VFSDGDMVFQWHRDTLELPEGARLLGTGDRVSNQAYRVGRMAWGLQFHFEIDAGELEMWLDEASAFMDIEEVWGKSAHAIRVEARSHMSGHESRGAEVFARFARLAAGQPAEG